MGLIVIEGDNGTGKDTIGTLLANDYGYYIPNYDKEASDFSSKLRSLDRRSQTFGFLEYSAILSKIARQHEKSLVIRYWMSTLAAAYADYVLSLEEVLEKAEELLEILLVPDYIFYLTCNFNKRIERINKRDATSSDNRTIERGERYERISNEIRKMFRHWYVIDTTNLTPKEICIEIKKQIQHIP